MNKFNSLNEFKESHKISDNKGRDISFIFREIFEEYSYQNFENHKKNIKLIDRLIEEAKEVNTNLIPYSEITNIIFSHYDYNGNESSFTEQWKSEFEKHIVKRFSEKDTQTTDNTPTTEDLFSKPSSSEMTSLNIDDNYQNALLVIYKLIQHAELAISQKQNLYQSLKDDVDNLTGNVYSASEKYNNMMSNFISILGIFAAIMMATFGAIQGFTAIFSNENNYSLTAI